VNRFREWRISSRSFVPYSDVGACARKIQDCRGTVARRLGVEAAMTDEWYRQDEWAAAAASAEVVADTGLWVRRIVLGLALIALLLLLALR
jgi:hypothetical protein